MIALPSEGPITSLQANVKQSRMEKGKKCDIAKVSEASGKHPPSK